MNRRGFASTAQITQMRLLTRSARASEDTPFCDREPDPLPDIVCKSEARRERKTDRLWLAGTT